MSNADDRHTQLKALAEGLLAIEGLCHVAAMVLDARGEFNTWRGRAQSIGMYAREVDAIRFERLYERAVEEAQSRPSNAPPTDRVRADGSLELGKIPAASTGSEAGVSAATCDVSGIAQPVTSNTGESSAAAPSPAPSSPRRWLLTVDSEDIAHGVCQKEEATYAEGDRLNKEVSLHEPCFTVPVVEASAYDAAVRDRDDARAELAEAKQKIAEAEGRCVARCRAARNDEASRFAPALQESRLARRLTPEVVERAAEAIAAKAGFAFEETNLLIDTRHIRGLARAALLAAGFREVAP